MESTVQFIQEKQINSQRNLGLYHLYIQILCTTTATISVKIQSYIFIMRYTSTVPNNPSCAECRDSSVADKGKFFNWQTWFYFPNLSQHPHCMTVFVKRSNPQQFPNLWSTAEADLLQ